MPRTGDTATLLPSGQLLVVGGTTQNAAPYVTGDSELYDPVANTWAKAASWPGPRSDDTATLLASGKVLVTGGATTFAPLEFTGDSELYDPASNTWTSAAPVPVARFSHAATLLPSGQVLVTGGLRSTSNNPAGAERRHRALRPGRRRLDPGRSVAGGAKRAESRAPAPVLSSGAVLVTAGQGIGAGTCTATSDTELYDPSTNRWADAAPLPNARGGATATLLESGDLLVAGGRLSGSTNIVARRPGTASCSGSLGWWSGRVHRRPA